MLKLLPLIIIAILFCFCSTEDKTLSRTGEYFGEKPPDTLAKLFAPGVITKGFTTRDVAMSPDGNEIYFSATVGNLTTILFTEKKENQWLKPEVADFARNPLYKYIEPHIAPGGDKFYFVTNKPVNDIGQPKTDYDIWVMDKEGEGWGEPYNLGSPINTSGSEFFPSVTKDGTIYYTFQPNGDRINYIYRSKFVNGEYEIPERLGENVNAGRTRFNAFIDPDERFIIVPIFGLPDSYGATDYYLSFRRKDDVWSSPINLGEKINSKSGLEFSPYVSPDGRYLFFMSARDSGGRDDITYEAIVEKYNKPGATNSAIYWISSSFLSRLKPAGF